MTSYFDKKRKQKLYQQWVENSGLPPESIPADVDGKNYPDESPEDGGEMRRPGISTNLTLRLTMRHILYLLLTIVVLLAATVSLATILVTRSC